MFTLVRDCSSDEGETKSSKRSPKYIILNDQLTTFGRGLRNDIRLVYPWVSRKHFTISKVRNRMSLQCSGKNGTFVNSVKEDRYDLKNGDWITIGGNPGQSMEVNSEFPSQHGPHLIYQYSKNLQTVDDPDNIYSAPKETSENIITLNEENFLGSAEVKYHVEDFNLTDSETIYSGPKLPLLTPKNKKPGKTGSKKAKQKSSMNSPSTSTGAGIKTCNDEEESGCSSATFADLKTASVSEQNDEIPDEAPSTSGLKKSPKKVIKKPVGRKAGKGKRKLEEIDVEVSNSAKKSHISAPIEGETVDESGISASQSAKSVKSDADITEHSGNLARNPSPVAGDCPPETELISISSNSTPVKGRGKGTRKRKKPVKLNDSEDEEYVIPQTVPKGKGAGKGKSIGKGKGKGKKGMAVDSANSDLVKAWVRPGLPQPRSQWVTIFEGEGYAFNSYKFDDETLFKRFPEAYNCYNSTEKFQFKIDVPKCIYALLNDTLGASDKMKFYNMVLRENSVAKMDMFKNPRCPVYETPIPQPSEISIDMKEYQLKTVAWMTGVENKVEEGWNASKLIKWQQGKWSLMLEPRSRLAFKDPIQTSPITDYLVKIKGGILADEMGLGKTITLLGLLVHHRAHSFPRIPNVETFDPYADCRFPCHATLVVAPSHLTGQWKSEIETNAKGLKVILITTKVHFDKTRYLDVLEADIVIVSVQFLLANKIYNKRPTRFEAKTEFISLMTKPDSNPLLEVNPNLCHFNWWRIVSDEAHELLTYDRDRKGNEKPSPGLDLLSAIPSKHRWYMTGTPFPNGEKSLKACMTYLHMTVDDPMLVESDGALKVDKCSYTDELNVGPLYELIKANFFVRNTKQTIGLEYNVPEYVEELMLLTMSKVERGIYDRSFGERSKRQICCHLQLDNQIGAIMGTQQKTLDEVKDLMLKDTKKRLDADERNAETTKEDIRKARNEYASETRVNQRNYIQNRIERHQGHLKFLEEQKKKHMSSISYFESIVPRITHSAEEPCVICLENIERLTVTPCGHLFCYDCILSCIERQNLCPTCRQQVNRSQLVEVKDKEERENLTKKLELERLTEKFGTKMAYLIFYLRYLFRENKEARVIIFSQWDSMLQKIGDTLKQNAINNVFVKGNVHCRNKAITSFRKQLEVRVIMLSLEHAASGTNLVEASHVILIDPVAGTKAQAHAVESQAIGRAHRMGQDKQIVVARMIMKDTIEHDLYQRNNDEDIRQVEFEFEQQDPQKSADSNFGLDGVQVVRTVRKVPPPADPKDAARALEASSRVQDRPEPNPYRGGEDGWPTPGELMHLFDGEQFYEGAFHRNHNDSTSGSGSESYDDDERDKIPRVYPLTTVRRSRTWSSSSSSSLTSVDDPLPITRPKDIFGSDSDSGSGPSSEASTLK